MQGGPTSAGDISPPNLIEITCIPDIQQTNTLISDSRGTITTSNRNSASSIHDNTTKNNAIVLSTNNNHTTNSNNTTTVPLESLSLDPSEQQSSRSNSSRSSSLLLITHVVEMAAMILVTLLRFVPPESKNSSQTPLSKTPLVPDSSSKEDFSSLVLGLHISILIIPLIIVTALSLHWVLRVQDFSGKIVARLVCWVLHSLQSSLIWRYLKLQIAYDPGDFAELRMLRFIQLHIHILPFLVMHVAITLSYPFFLGLALSLAFTLLFSVVTTIVVSTVIQQQITPPALTQMCQFTITETDPNSSSKPDDSKCHMIVGATKMCVLWCRIVSIAALFCLHSLWAIGLIVIHWLFAVIWLGFQKEVSSNILSSRQIVRRSFGGYLLLWDWQLFGGEESSPATCSHTRSPVIYYTIVASQNIAATCAWYVTERLRGISLLYTVVLTSVIISQVMALLLLSLSYVHYSYPLFKWPLQKTSASLSRKASLLVRPTEKASASDLQSKLSSSTNSPSSPKAHINVESTEEVVNLKNANDSRKLHSEDKITKRRDSMKQKEGNKCSPSLTPRLLTNHLHSSMFSYANDILPHTSKSEGSSTWNGSFNSRNTNTLNTHGVILPDYEISHPPHGSFSDSFSSLSCGTVNKVFSSTPKGNFHSQLHLHQLKKIKHRKSCHRSICRTKVLHRVSHDCAEVEEEQDEVVMNKDTPEEQNSCNSTKKGTSPPRVTVVRAIQRFQVVCTKCLSAHDPLLTQCRTLVTFNGPPSLSYSCAGELGGTGESSSTDYPSDTELTTTIDTLSSVSAESHSTYTTWPVGKGPGLAKLLMREKGGHEYVTAWLRHQQARATTAPPTQEVIPFHDTRKRAMRERSYYQSREGIKCFRHPRRNGQRTSVRPRPTFVQDLETVV